MAGTTSELPTLVSFTSNSAAHLVSPRGAWRFSQGTFVSTGSDMMSIGGFL